MTKTFYLDLMVEKRLKIFVFFIIPLVNLIKIMLKGDAASNGIVRLAIEHFINHANVTISAVEIYNGNNKYFDLLNGRKKVGFSYESGEYKGIRSVLLVDGNVDATLRSIRERTVVKNNKENELSSRGHCLIYLNIETPQGLKW